MLQNLRNMSPLLVTVGTPKRRMVEGIGCNLLITNQGADAACWIKTDSGPRNWLGRAFGLESVGLAELPAFMQAFAPQVIR